MKKAKLFKPKSFKSGKKHVTNRRNKRHYGYDKNWDRYRFRFLHHNPNCYICPSPSKVVDHIVPAKVNWDTYFWKVDNYLPLCSSCHSTITQKFDRMAIPDQEGKIRYLIEKRKDRNISVSVKITPFKGEPEAAKKARQLNGTG